MKSFSLIFIFLCIFFFYEVGSKIAEPVDIQNPFLTVTYIISLFGTYPSQRRSLKELEGVSNIDEIKSGNPWVGEIAIFGGNFAPSGAQFGGDGRTTFALPDLRGRSAIHHGSGPGLTQRIWSNKGGDEVVILTEDNIPLNYSRIDILEDKLQQQIGIVQLQQNTIEEMSGQLDEEKGKVQDLQETTTYLIEEIEELKLKYVDDGGDGVIDSSATIGISVGVPVFISIASALLSLIFVCVACFCFARRRKEQNMFELSDEKDKSVENEF